MRILAPPPGGCSGSPCRVYRGRRHYRLVE